ncbi:MAG: 23S rRNA (guanosine(2251)-2'-O)-methyltransferase RlmB [Clostridiales bacterium]|jgi:23S rRNA (guanosine2251-2'-O)-methyltransferase|nr:23S rRNA (guanosine(2251)-2'-O)-methyltransferase RlmB [Clostridiales bacterium]
MIVEGKNPVKELLKGSATIEKLYVQKNSAKPDPQLSYIVARALERKIKVIYAEKELLDKLSVSGRHQGALAVTTDFKYADIKDILAADKAKGARLILVLDGIEDPHNLGAIIRVAECAGANGIIIGKHRAAGVTDAVVKVSAGASAHVKIARVTNINDAIRTLKDEFINIVAADMDGEPIYSAKPLRGDIALVIGGEGEGVHALTKKLCDRVVSLPTLGKVNSLNASVACGIALYEIIRQRDLKV